MPIDISAIRSDLSIASSPGPASYWTSPYSSRPPTSAPITPAFRTPTSPTTAIPAEIASLVGLDRLVYPAELPKYYLRFEVNKYNRNSLLRLGKLDPEQNIILPLPLQLIDAHNVSYNPTELGPLLGAAGTGINSLIEKLRGSGGDREPSRSAPSNIAGAIQGTWSRIGAEIAGTAASLVGSDSAGALLNAFSGLAPNQFLTILLQGPTYKSFNFQWQFGPNTPQEAVTLNKIIRAFNNYMAPGLSNLTQALFTFPRIFRIAIMPNSRFMYKFKPAVLTNFTVNYTPAQQPAFLKATPTTGGLPTPEGVFVSMQFIELEFWLNADFKDNNYPFDIDNIVSITPPSSGTPPPSNNPGAPPG